MPGHRNPYLIPAAIIMGCGMLAIAVYLGLSKRPGQPSTSVSSAGKPSGDRPPVTRRAGAGRAATNHHDRRLQIAQPRRRKATRRVIALSFRDRWRGLRDQVARKCQPQRYLKADKSTWHVEFPLELSITTTGEISTVRSFDAPRLVESSGTYVRLSLTAAQRRELVQCYGAAIKRTIRFGASGSPRVKKYWLRILSTVE